MGTYKGTPASLFLFMYFIFVLFEEISLSQLLLTSCAYFQKSFFFALHLLFVML